MTDSDVSRRPADRGHAEGPKPTRSVRLLGAIGAAIIAVTLFGARVWARITRTPYYRD